MGQHLTDFEVDEVMAEIDVDGSGQVDSFVADVAVSQPPPLSIPRARYESEPPPATRVGRACPPSATSSRVGLAFRVTATLISRLISRGSPRGCTIAADAIAADVIDTIAAANHHCARAGHWRHHCGGRPVAARLRRAGDRLRRPARHPWVRRHSHPLRRPGAASDHLH